MYNLKTEQIRNKIRDINYWKKEQLIENYLIQFPNRTYAQANRYANRKLQKEINNLKKELLDLTLYEQYKEQQQKEANDIGDISIIDV